MDPFPPTSTGDTDPGSARRDFKALFCEQYHCGPEEFEERAFRVCLYGRARVLAPLIRAMRPGYFDPDFALIRYLARAPGRRDAINELAAFMDANNTRGGFARKFLGIRISSRKTSQLIAALFDRRARRQETKAAAQNAH